jgi:hypothetical protein
MPEAPETMLPNLSREPQGVRSYAWAREGS